MQPILQDLARRQLRHIFRDVDASCVQVEVLHGLALLASAQNDADPTIFRRLPLMAI
jgi:hypothetical protein